MFSIVRLGAADRLLAECAMLPVVAIVGRPNVGKSSLLNFLAQRRISIVDPTAGVTRDRVSTPIEVDGKWFDLTDTGGYGIVDKDELTEDVERQIQHAIEQAQLILFVVDVRDGTMALDQTVAEYLRDQNKPVILVANKADAEGLANQTAEFYKLGFGEPLPVSTTQNRGRTALLDAIIAKLDFTDSDAGPAVPEVKIAVVGKRNAGKSTLINAVAGEPRVIVSEIPGTTRDSVDVRVEHDGKSLLIIDTAGVRKKSKMTSDDLEFYSFHRAQRSIRRADVVILLADSTLALGDVDKKLGAYIAAEYRPCIVCFNKWDLVGDKATMESFEKYVGEIFPNLDYAPLAFISAKDNHGIGDLLKLSEVLNVQFRTRLKTSQLNGAVEQILELRGPSSPTAQKVKVYYATQIDTAPPTIVLFVNNPELITEEYRRFFVRQLRERLPFAEVPIKLHVRSHHRSFEKADKS
jgi:GTP-binding protein